MTNEQLAEFIQEGDSDLKPVLWERVKKLLYMFSRRYYSRYADYCERCGVTEWDLKQQAYSAFELSLQGYSSERGAFSTYLTFGFKRSIRELFKSKDPLNTAESLDRLVDEEDESGGAIIDFIPDQRAAEPFEELEDKDICRAVRAAVDALPEREQATIRALYFENKKYKDVAEFYGVTVQAVAEYSRKAFAKLRKNRELRRLSDDLGYGSQAANRNTLGSFKRFGVSGVEYVASERADIEARRAARDAAMQEYERISEKLRAGEITFTEYKEQTKDAVEFLVYS